MSGGKHNGAYLKTAGANARFGGLAFVLLLLAGLSGAVPLAAQVTPSSYAAQGEWSWMCGSDDGNPSGMPDPTSTWGPCLQYFPGGRWGAASWIDSSNHLWLFGGFGYAANGNFGYLNDLWQFDPTTPFANEWAWMGGSETVAANYGGEAPVYGSASPGTFAPTNIPGGRENASSWIDSNGNLWLFGGQGEGAASASCTGASFGDLNDLWEFDITSKEWAWMGGGCTPNAPGTYGTAPGGQGGFANGIVPGARYAASTWTDSNGNFWLFGGFGYDSTGIDVGELNDLWEFSPAKNQWAWINGGAVIPQYSGNKGVAGSQGSFCAGCVPGSRYGASSWTDGGNLWLFGGAGFDAAGNSANLNDLWEFNLSANEWAWMGGNNIAGSGGVDPGTYGTEGSPSTNNLPGGRYYAATWIDTSGNLWLFGGDGDAAGAAGGFLNDLWAFNPPTGKWVWVSGGDTPFQFGYYGSLTGSPHTPTPNNVPGTRYQSTSWIDNIGNLWLFGGDGYPIGGSASALNDLWVYPPPAISFGGTPATIQISSPTPPLPAGFPGESYYESFTATGGSGTYTWSVVPGSTALSAVGLSLTPQGVISGYPNATETAAQFTVKVTDSLNNSATQTYALTIYPGIVSNPTTLPAGTTGTPYSQQLSGSGGSGAPYTFSVVAGTGLSAVGLTLSSAGLISGTPSGTETAAPFTVQIADSLGDFTHQNYTLSVNAAAAPLTISPTTLPAGTAGTPYSQQLTATGGSGTGYTWQVISGATSLGDIGLTLSAGAVIIGASPVAGQANFTVQVSDSHGDTAMQSYTLTITPAGGQPAMVTDNETITVTDTVPDAADPETITVTDTVNISGPLNITTAASAPTGIVGVPYAPIAMFTASGGVPPYRWASTGLPAGLGIASSTGVISGTPATAGDFLVTATVTDSLGNSVFALSPITIDNPVPMIISVDPQYTTAGSQISPIVVSGSGFVIGSTVNWNGSPLSTQVVGPTTLFAQVPNSDVATAGLDNITVVNPGPGGGLSTSAWQFEVSPAGNGTGSSPIVKAVNDSITPGSSASYTVGDLPGDATNISVQYLDLPAGASCSFTNPLLTIATSTNTPAGTYTIVVVFTYTLPGAASSSLIVLPLLLLPLVFARKRWARARVVTIAILGLALLALTNVGCTSGSHQATSVTSVTLIVQ